MTVTASVRVARCPVLTPSFSLLGDYQMKGDCVTTSLCYETLPDDTPLPAVSRTPPTILHVAKPPAAARPLVRYCLFVTARLTEHQRAFGRLEGKRQPVGRGLR